MMKYFYAFCFSLILTTGFLACSYGDDEYTCDPIEWVGTYNLSTNEIECTLNNETINYPLTMVIEEGTDGNIIYDGKDIPVNEVTCKATLDGIDLEFNGTDILYNPGTICEVVYSRN